MGRSKSFVFDGGAATYIGTGVLAFVVTIASLGLAYPYALVLRHRWRAKHTYVNGHRLVFEGTARSLIWQWIKWWVLIVLTLGVYSLWVMPRLNKWVIENTDFDPRWAPHPVHTGQPDAALAAVGVSPASEATLSTPPRDPFEPDDGQIRFVLMGLAPSDEQWELPAGSYRLGVGPDMDLDVEDPTGTVGDFHAELVVDPSALTIAAREGNSIFIGGRRVRSSFEDVPHGAEIRLGKLEFGVQQVGRDE